MKFTFLTRDLLWFMVVVACCVLWRRDRLELNSYREEKLIAQHEISGTKPQKLPDQQISTAIVQKLQAEKKDGRLRRFNLELQIEAGTVWLSGRVASPQHLSRVLQIARNEPGVKQVMNEITVDKNAGFASEVSDKSAP
jgi:BON domain